MPQPSAEILAVKNAVRERDGYRCTECGMTGEQHMAAYGRDLDVHRTVPGSPYTVEGSVTFCRACHGPQARRRRGEPERAYEGVLVSMKLGGPLAAAVGAFMASLPHPVAKTRLLRAALERYLEAKGFWPPKNP